MMIYGKYESIVLVLNRSLSQLLLESIICEILSKGDIDVMILCMVCIFHTQSG